MTDNNACNSSAKTDDPIPYPCDFPIKIMGESNSALTDTVIKIAKKHDPEFDTNTVELRDSSSGKYVGVTITIHAKNRQQLDAIYQELSAHPLVKVVL